jgi:hypothetical protein
VEIRAQRKRSAMQKQRRARITLEEEFLALHDQRFILG